MNNNIIFVIAVAMWLSWAARAGASPEAEHFGTTPPNAILTREFRDCDREFAVYFPLDAQFARGLLPSGFTLRSYAMAAPKWDVARKLVEAHPEVAEMARGVFSFVHVPVVVVGAEKWQDVTFAFFWIAVASHSADSRLRGPEYLQAYEWVNEGGPRKAMKFAAGDAGPASVVFSLDQTGHCKGRLTADEMEIALDCDIAKESKSMGYEEAQYQTLWLAAPGSAPSYLFNTFFGHWQQAGSNVVWQGHGNSPLATQLAAAIRNGTAQSAHGLVSRWSARQSLFAPSETRNAK
jgi:hypothetical protein